MGMPFLSLIDLPRLAEAPASGAEGQAYFDTTLRAVRVHDGTSWRTTGQHLFVQDAQPTNPPDRYVWVQTGLGDAGDDWTLWFEDGTP